MSCLKKNEWCFYLKDSEYLFKKINIERGIKKHYEKVYMWLPDVRWVLKGTSFCTIHKINKHDGAHAFRKSHNRKRITDLKILIV